VPGELLLGGRESWTTSKDLLENNVNAALLRVGRVSGGRPGILTNGRATNCVDLLAA
jgi:hypothetical protein